MGYTIPIESLKMSCGQAAYEKGLRLYQMNNVQGIRAELSGDIVYIEAQVISSARNSTYYVTLEYDFENRKLWMWTANARLMRPIMVCVSIALLWP